MAGGAAGWGEESGRLARRPTSAGTRCHEPGTVRKPRPLPRPLPRHRNMADSDSPSHTLRALDRNIDHSFILPVKRINDGDDVSFFLASNAYADIMTFIFQLNVSMLPRRVKNEQQKSEVAKEWTLQDPDVSYPPVVQNLAKLLETLGAIIDEAPPDPGPRRFGNISFRKWYDLVKERVPDLMDQYLPSDILTSASTGEVSAKAELEAYLTGSFGSAQRLDYGTGHELSFIAFLGGLWKLGAFPESVDGSQERAIVLGVIEPYVAPSPISDPLLTLLDIYNSSGV